eukprot:COSAG05_NODE_2356_length_3186_cov_2.372530_5_plen_201_part_00
MAAREEALRALQGLSNAGLDFMGGLSPQEFRGLVQQATRRRQSMSVAESIVVAEQEEAQKEEALCATQPFDDSQRLSQESLADTVPFLSQTPSQRLADVNSPELEPASPSDAQNTALADVEQPSTLQTAAAAVGPRGPFARAAAHAAHATNMTNTIISLSDGAAHDPQGRRADVKESRRPADLSKFIVVTRGSVKRKSTT